MGVLLLNGSTDLNPRELFANGEQGLWLDPSQMSTMYQDSNGVTPCTAAGDPVGLILDQSRGGLGALGPELVTNGGFTSDVSGWTNTGSGTFVWSSGSGLFTRTTFTDNASQSFSTTSGKFYRITFDVVSGSNARVAFNTSATVASVIAENVGVGTYSRIVQATSTTMYLVLTASANVAIAFDNISVREVPGNHAYQTSSSARPTLARIPSSGRRNLLLNTEPADSTGYAFATNVSFVTESAFSFLPSGGRAASYGDASVNRRLQFNFTSFVIGQTYTLSFYIYLNGGVEPNQGAGLYRDFTLTRDGADVTNYANITYDNIGGGVYRVKHTWTHTGAGTSLTIWKYSGLSTNTNFRASGFQLETGSTATNLQRVESTHDVTESGVSDLWHLVFDGSDDSLTTNSVDMTGTAQMTVIAGVRKLSDAAIGILAELSASVSLNAGSFYLTAPESTGASGNFTWKTRGSADPGTFASVGTILAPASRVISGLGDISSDIMSIRNNGTQTDSSVDLGSGNYGNYQLFIGRRGGSSLPFNGHLYQLIIRGKTTSGSKLLEAERFAGKKTGVSF